MIKSPSIAYSLNSKVSFKIIVIGECRVGKTSLILRYVKGLFEHDYAVTVGVEFYSKLQRISKEEIALKIWDTAGQENFKSIVRSFYHLSSCAIIVYCHPEELSRSVQNCMLQINQNAADGIVMVLARTKTDAIPLTEEERVEVELLKQKYRLSLFMEVCAKTNTNVTEFFQKVGEILYDKFATDDQFRDLVDPKTDSFVLSSRQDSQMTPPKKKCC